MQEFHVNETTEQPLLRDIAYQKLLTLIMDGTLKAGTMLQERRLAEALGLSRTPVREALSQLQTEGLVTFHGRRSASIPKLEVVDFVEILKVRRLLEAEAARLAAERGLPEEKVTRIRMAIADFLQIPAPSPVEHWEVDDLIHGSIAEASQNQLLHDTIRDLRRRTHIFDTNVIPERRVPGAAEHLLIIDAIEKRDPAAAADAMAAHIDNIKRSIVERITRGA